MATVALVASLSILVGACGGAPRWMQGKWEGMGDQVDGQTWLASLDATDLSKVVIAYPGLECGGNWLVEKRSGDACQLREHLAYGLENCDQDVEVVVHKPVDGVLHVEYFIRAMDPVSPVAQADLKPRD